MSAELSGTIPKELGNLTGLTRLHLFSNGLSGTIPTQLGDLTNLRLSANNLSGTIPAQLGDLTNLTHVKLYDNSPGVGDNADLCVPQALLTWTHNSKINQQQTCTTTQTPAPEASPTEPPDPVTDISVTHNGTSLSVTWDSSEGATAYDVTYYGNSTNARAAWNRAGTSLEITCDVRPTHLNQNCVNSTATYTVGIRARNTAGESAWRNSTSAQPPPTG